MYFFFRKCIANEIVSFILVYLLEKVITLEAFCNSYDCINHYSYKKKNFTRVQSQEEKWKKEDLDKSEISNFYFIRKKFKYVINILIHYAFNL